LEHLGEKLFSRERIRAIVAGIQRELKARDQRLEGQRKSLRRRLETVEARLVRQYEAIESGLVDLRDVGARIRELKADRDKLETQLAEIKPARVVPSRLYGEESLTAFQATVKEMFLGNADRFLVKRYLRLFLDKIVIDLPKVELVGKSEVVLAVLENEKAVRATPDAVLTAVGAWLPGTDSNRRHGG
jgi:hypothetical protein